ncbi:MFS general substrate transporter, partial [Flammula alnicola]
KARKIGLLTVVCIAEFLDTFSNSALFSAIPPICLQLGISNSDSVWLQSGYQLTFAALLLISGRLSDLYNPKWVFIIGGMSFGCFSLGGGFVRSEVPLLVLRALMGVGAALTVPSAMHMIVHLFPEPTSQSVAIGVFSTSGALGNMFGLIIGALLTSFASWPWVFYFMAILGILEAVVVYFLCPHIPRPKSSTFEKAKRFQRLDLFGVGLFTASLILFVFALTSGASTGWGQARVIAPLVISIVLLGGFFVYEAYLPEYLAAVPPKTWKYENFGILIATALLPYMWWGCVQSLYSWVWQEVYGWTPIISAVHFLALSLVGIPGTVLATVLQQKLRLKWVMFIGECIAIVGSILLPFANTRQRYWRFAFPGTLLGSLGVLVTFVTSNVAIFATTPPEAAGVVAAIFNSSLQLGCAAGIAIVTSIQTSIQATHGGPTSFVGRADGFWFLFASVCALTLALLVFMKDTIPPL